MERNFKKSQNFLKTFHFELLHMGSKKCGFSIASALFSNFVLIVKKATYKNLKKQKKPSTFYCYELAICKESIVDIFLTIYL